MRCPTDHEIAEFVLGFGPHAKNVQTSGAFLGHVFGCEDCSERHQKIYENPLLWLKKEGKPCPNDEELAEYCLGEASAELTVRIGTHLGECSRCIKRLDEFPKGPMHCLGRPMPEEHCGLMKVEREVVSLVAALNHGSVIKVGGDWQNQEFCYSICAIAAGRIERKGRTTSISGRLLDDSETALPKSQVAVLLEAPTFENLGVWVKPSKRQARLLIGETAMWRKRGIEPDALIESEPKNEMALSSYFADLKVGWQGSIEQKMAILMAGLNCDIPYQGEPLFPLVALRNNEGKKLPWCSTSGTWLTREFLRRQSADEIRQTQRRIFKKQSLPGLTLVRLMYQILHLGLLD